MHRPFERMGRDEGQVVQDEAEGEEQVAQSGWHVAQVPLSDRAPDGQEVIQLPPDAKAGETQRVHESEVPIHSAHPDEQPVQDQYLSAPIRMRGILTLA